MKYDHGHKIAQSWPGEGESGESSQNSSCGQLGVAMDRRKFLAQAGAVGLALVHFTLLGGGPAQAGCPPEACIQNPAQDNCDAGKDAQGEDSCGQPPCTQDTTGKDFCQCGLDQRIQDHCGCDYIFTQDGGVVDYCQCPLTDMGVVDGCAENTAGGDCCNCPDDQNLVDYCTDKTAGQDVDYCACNEDVTADVCRTDCPQDTLADFCRCDNDTNNADKCTCAAEPQDVDWCECKTDPGNADACSCDKNDTNGVDYCACDGDAGNCDKCQPGQGAPTDYCCAQNDTTGDV
jgi:hypothetical protein